jgi:hypothetical protein
MQRAAWIAVICGLGMAFAAGRVGAAASSDSTQATSSAADSAKVPAGKDSTVVAAVTYVVGSTVYFDAGRDQGLVGGGEGSLLRGDQVLGKITVLDLSSHRGTGTVETGVTAEVGDRARFHVIRIAGPPAPTAPAAMVATAARPAGETLTTQRGIRGRAGIRYLAVQDQTGSGSDFTQPAADLALEVLHPGGTPFNLNVDTRARHTYLSGGADEARTRVYRLEASWDPKRVHVALGRVVAPQVPSVGLIDGGRVEVSLDPFAVGAFLGTQPEPDTYALSGDVKQYGIYSRVQGAFEGGRWGGILGWANSIAGGESNRNFFYLAGDLSSHRLQLHGNQDVDLNQGWKATAEGRSVTFSNTYLSGRYQIVPRLALRASFDNRRNVRLFTDKETPESQFDASYRQGFSLATEWRQGAAWSADLSYRSSRGVDGDARSGTLALRIPRFPARPIDLNLRGTVYDGPEINGWLSALGVAWRATSRLDLGVHGGLRSEDRSFGLGEHVTVDWFGAEGDLSLLSSWYLNLSAEITRGDAERTNQIYTSLTYRF